MTQESLIPPKGLVCDKCGKPSTDHTYHQVQYEDLINARNSWDMYLCTKCYKERKAKRHE